MAVRDRILSLACANFSFMLSLARTALSLTVSLVSLALSALSSTRSAALSTARSVLSAARSALRYIRSVVVCAPAGPSDQIVPTASAAAIVMNLCMVHLLNLSSARRAPATAAGLHREAVLLFGPGDECPTVAGRVGDRKLAVLAAGGAGGETGGGA